MKNFTIAFLTTLLVLFVSSLFAGDPVVVDVTGHDYEQHYYVHNSLGSRIAVSDNGDVHVVYNKSFATAEGDTGYTMLYKNVTTGAQDTIRSQQPEEPIQLSRAYIAGGQGSAPLFILTGISTYDFTWGAMSLQALSAVEDGKVVAKGRQTSQNYYADAWYALPITMEVDATNGVAHVIGTNVGGDAIYYWNCDGTNFSGITNMYHVYPDQNVAGKPVPGHLRRNATKGADLAISSGGYTATVAIGGLHPWSNIDVTYGTHGGDIWPTDYQVAASDGSFIFLFDTTNASTGDNFTDHSQAKPATDLQLAYDDNDVLHIVYEAAWFDHKLDTLSNASFIARTGTDKWAEDWNWMTTHLYLAGDEDAVYYGTGHPKPQIRYWNSNMALMATSTDAHVKVAESLYPLAGEEYKWFHKENIDSGYAVWGNRGSCIIEDIDLVINSNPQPGEPKAVVVYEQMASAPTVIEDGAFWSPARYIGYYRDIYVSTTDDFTNWTSGVNLTNTADVDEGELSVHPDVIDNKVHIVYNVDDLPGTDYFVQNTEAYGGLFARSGVRADQNVSVTYQEVDLSGISSIEDTKNQPREFTLAQNYPNPFNPTTTISYTVPTGNVKMEIYNLLGQKVKTLVNKSHAAGTYNEVWNGTNDAGNLVSSGVYLYKLKTKAGVKVKKLVLQK